MNIVRQFLLERYTCGDSVIHRLDARIKLFFLVLISFSLFLTAKIEIFSYPFVLLVLVIAISRIKVSCFLKGIIPIIWMIGFIIILHSLIPPGNMEYGLKISIRLLLLFLWATVLTVTTPSSELGKVISWYARPLRIFKISPENIGLTFSLSLRFFPIILEEAQTIIRVHKLSNRKLTLKEKIESFCTVFFTRVLKRARSIETDIDNKNLNNEKLKELNSFNKLRWIEILVMIIGLIYIFLIYKSNF